MIVRDAARRLARRIAARLRLDAAAASRGGRTLLRRSLDRLQGRRHVHFLHIGKTGGTAIKHALAPYVHGERFVLHLHGHATRLRNVPPSDLFFFVLRDPLSRFCSGFWSRWRRGRPRHSSPWTAAERAAFTRFESPDALARALSSDDEDERCAAETAMRTIAHVRTFLWDWLESEAYLLSRRRGLLWVGFQASLRGSFPRLREQLLLPDSVELPQDDVNAHRNPKALSYELSAQSERNLRRWYARDYSCISALQQYSWR